MSHRSYKGSNFSSCRNSSSQYTGPTAIHQNRKIQSNSSQANRNRPKKHSPKKRRNLMMECLQNSTNSFNWTNSGRNAAQDKRNSIISNGSHPFSFHSNQNIGNESVNAENSFKKNTMNMNQLQHEQGQFNLLSQQLQINSGDLDEFYPGFTQHQQSPKRSPQGRPRQGSFDSPSPTLQFRRLSFRNVKGSLIRLQNITQKSNFKRSSENEINSPSQPKGNKRSHFNNYTGIFSAGNIPSNQRDNTTQQQEQRSKPRLYNQASIANIVDEQESSPSNYWTQNSHLNEQNNFDFQFQNQAHNNHQNWQNTDAFQQNQQNINNNFDQGRYGAARQHHNYHHFN